MAGNLVMETKWKRNYAGRKTVQWMATGETGQTSRCVHAPATKVRDREPGIVTNQNPLREECSVRDRTPTQRLVISSHVKESFSLGVLGRTAANPAEEEPNLEPVSAMEAAATGILRKRRTVTHSHVLMNVPRK